MSLAAENADIRILIVDDTAKNIQVLGTILKQRGYQVNVAQNGMQALAIVEKMPPDLVLLDIMMPEMDGFEVCEKLKENPQTRDIPVIFLTAKTETDSVIIGFELGAVDYITKPFNSTELLARVKTQVELQRNRKMIEEISNERKELLHILCHDLANPLNSIISLINMTGAYFSFEEAKPMLMSAAENGLDVINLVREMRALEEHTLTLIPINMRTAVDESLTLLKQKFMDKDLQVEVKITRLPTSRINSLQSII